MTENRAASLHAYFGYRDAVAALRWLEDAFGFETTMRYPDDKGGIAHSELRRGNASFVVFSDDEGYEKPPRKGDSVGHGLYIALGSEAEVDAVYASATKHGAETVWAPDTTVWGNYRCRVADPEGYEWTFGTHVPGEPAEDWSQEQGA